MSSMLPSKKHVPALTIGRLRIFLYSKPKLGKSTLASEFPGALFLPTEAGLGSLECFRAGSTPTGLEEDRMIHDWEEFRSVMNEVVGGGHAFRTLIVDTVDNLYSFCVDWIVEKKKVEFIGDLEYGKGAALVRNEFTRVLTLLSGLPYGLVFISHSQEKRVKDRAGNELTVIAPTLTDKASGIVLGMADMILYGDIERVAGKSGPEERRVLRTKPTRVYEAGDRTGRLPDTLPFSYAAFEAAFNAAVQPAGPAGPVAPAATVSEPAKRRGRPAKAEAPAAPTDQPAPVQPTEAPAAPEPVAPTA